MTLQAAFLDQAQNCVALGSPFMGRLLTGLAENWHDDSALARMCKTWTGDIGPSGASLPLRIAGGLHALVISERAPELVAVYPPNTVSDDVLTQTVLKALSDHSVFLLDWMQTAPQTNEVRRSMALIAAAHWIAERHPLPFALSELGASAGLNLMFDSFALSVGADRLGAQDPVLTLAPDWDGAVPTPAQVQVSERRGVDLNPLNTCDPDHALRLFAFLWPDQPHRKDLTEKAISVHDAVVDADDAVTWLEQRLSTPKDGCVHLIYHTVAWQYFPPERQAHGTALIEAAGARATENAPLAWLSMEADGGTGAALTLRLWPGDHRIELGRADFHGRWMQWTAP